MQPIVITTPNGTIGQHVVQTLLHIGEPVRVITRHPHQLADAVQTNAEIVQGSTNDPALLTQALDGAEALFWCIPQSHTQTNVLDYYLRFAHAVAIAIRRTSIARIVTVSSGGKGIAHNAGAISALHAMEDVLNETGVAVRHLRCGNFMENFLWQQGTLIDQHRFFYPLAGEFPIPMVATQDIAAIAAHWLTHRNWSDQRGIAIHGAEDLSMNQAAERFSHVLRKPIQYQQIPPHAFIESMLKRGASLAFAQSLVDLFAAVEAGIYRAEPRTAETTTPTTLQQWAIQVMSPALYH